MTAALPRTQQQTASDVRKAAALRPSNTIGIFAPASPAQESRVNLGMEELRSLGFAPQADFSRESQAYFSADAPARLAHFRSLLNDEHISALIGLRGGYGSNYLLDELWNSSPGRAKCIVGYSDVTSLQILLWQKLRWVTFYGPMVAAGFDAGKNAPHGYDPLSLDAALSGNSAQWKINLAGESMAAGTTNGVLLGGCLTLIETTLGTPWELDTDGSILLLEDRGMKPWQVDRALMHLAQAGKFHGVKGIVLGEFPDCEPPVAGSPTAKEVCERILKPLGVPVVWGAAVGHTPRPMLTIPLGIQAKLTAEGTGTLEFLETAVIP
jgi:muramoyltetrapeptide carboxypeptidase